MLEGYATGYNRYLRDYAGRYPATCNGAAWMRPITVEDMHLVIAEKALHASGQVFAKEIVAAAQARPLVHQNPAGPVDCRKAGQQRLGDRQGPVRQWAWPAARHPHYPWTTTDRFYQAHLTVPNRYDAMGVVLGGIPMVVIGFNKDVAWTHTVTTAVHFTTFKLALDARDGSGTSYLSDGVSVKMRVKPVTVSIRMPDASMASRTKTFFFSRQGAVLVNPDAGLTWSTGAVHGLADPNRNNTRMVDQIQVTGWSLWRRRHQATAPSTTASAACRT